MDAMFLYSKIDEEFQPKGSNFFLKFAVKSYFLIIEPNKLEMLSTKQSPGDQETRVGWFFEVINGNKSV